MFLARLAEELGTRRPDLPLLVIESRGTADAISGGGAGGRVRPPAAREPAFCPGGGAAEGFSGVGQSDPGALGFRRAERAGGGGSAVQRVAAAGQRPGRHPRKLPGRGVRAAAAAGIDGGDARAGRAGGGGGWLEIIERLADDEVFYQEACARAAFAGRAYLPEVLGPRYVAFFERVLNAPSDASCLRAGSDHGPLWR